MKPNWELNNCCNHEQVVFLVTVAVCTVVILALWRTVFSDPLSLLPYFFMRQPMQLLVNLHAVMWNNPNTWRRILVNLASWISWFIFLGHGIILASANLLTARIAAGCCIVALLIVLFVAKNWTLRGLCIGFIIFLGVIRILQETTKILRYIILFIGVMNRVFSVYDIYDDLISRGVHSSDAEKFAEGFNIFCVSLRSCVSGCCDLVITDKERRLCLKFYDH